jgi:hypothetical protein
MTPATAFSPFLSVISINNNGYLYFVTGVVDTCKEPGVANISANLRNKMREDHGLWINPEVKSARYTVALKRQIWKYEAVVQVDNREAQCLW